MLRTLSSELELMQSRGFQTAPIDAAIEAIALDDWQARNSLESLRTNARVFGRAPSTTRRT